MKKESAWKQKCLEAQGKLSKVEGKLHFIEYWANIINTYANQALRELNQLNIGLAKNRLEYIEHYLNNLNISVEEAVVAISTKSPTKEGDK